MKYYLDSLRPIVSGHKVLEASFLLSFRNGSLTKDQFAQWLAQQFYFSISLPNAFAALYARIPDKFWQAKRELVPLLDVEAWGSKEVGAHSNAFKKVADYLEMDIQKLTQQNPKQYTKNYIDFRFGVCFDSVRAVTDGLCAIALGNEVLNLHLYKDYREGVHKIVGLENCPTDYFDAHLDDEEADFSIFARLFDLLVRSEQEREQSKYALIELLDQRVIFFEQLSIDIGLVN